MKIEIHINDITLNATLNNTPTAQKIAAALPLEGRANVWGQEIYFDIPVETALENDAVEEVEVGTLAYWPTGCAFCIFFGPTPVSTSDKPRAYSPVNIFGKLDGDATTLKSVTSGTIVQVLEIKEPNP